MRCFVDADRVLEMNELRLDGAVMKVRRAEGDESSVTMQQDRNGKFCEGNISNVQYHFTCHVAIVIYNLLMQSPNARHVHV